LVIKVGMKSQTKYRWPFWYCYRWIFYNYFRWIFY